MDRKFSLEFTKEEIDKIVELAEIHSGGIVTRKNTSESIMAHVEIMFLVRNARQELGLEPYEEEDEFEEC